MLGQNLRIFWNIQKPWFSQFSFTSKSSIYIYNISCFHSSVLFNHHDFPPFCQILEAITTTINTLRAETCGIYNLVTKLSLISLSKRGHVSSGWIPRLKFYKGLIRNCTRGKATFLSTFNFIVRSVKWTINNLFDIHVCTSAILGNNIRWLTVRTINYSLKCYEMINSWNSTTTCVICNS